MLINKPDYQWWVRHAHTDSSFLLLSKNPAAFEDAVRSRALEVGRECTPELLNHCAWRAVFEQDRFGSMSSILKDITAPPNAQSMREIQGILRVSERAIRDEKGPCPLAGVSAFWAPWAVRNNLNQITSFAEWARECGFGYVRWFGAHDWDGGINPSSTPSYFTLMQQTIDTLAQYGLRSQVTLFTRRHMVDNPVEYAREWASLVNENRDKVCLIECVNEWNHSDNGWSDWEVRDVANAFRSRTGAPLALSAPAAPTWSEMESRLSSLYGGTPANVMTAHFPRRQDTGESEWRWVRQPWHSRHHVSGCPPCVVDNEHQRWDRSASGRDVSVAVASLINAFIAGCAMSAHHDVYGVFNNRGHYSENPESQKLQQALSRVLPHLPANLPNWQSVRVGTGGGPHPFPSLLKQHWSFQNIDHGVSRAFAAINQDRFALVLNGVRHYVRLSDEQSKKFTVISLEHGGTIYEGHGPVRLHEADGRAFYVGTEME